MSRRVRDSCIRSYHTYQNLWEAALDDELQCKRELFNLKDRNAVAIIEEERVVGHLPQTISLACSLFICRGGNIKCEVTGTRRYSADLPQRGLEIPCCLIIEGQSKEVLKLVRVLECCCIVFISLQNL